MSSNRHRCKCDHCVYGREKKQLLNGGGMDWDLDEEELLPYRKGSRSNFNNRGTRACKKSKTGEQCVFDAKKVVGTLWRINRETGKWTPTLNEISVCSRCGKHGQWAYSFNSFY